MTEPLNDHDLTPIDPADIHVGMRVRVTHEIAAYGAWLPQTRVAEGTVTKVFNRDGVVHSLELDEEDVNAYNVRDTKIISVKVERAPYQLRTVVLGHQPDEDIDAVWVKRPYGWYEVSNFDSADEVIVTKVLWAPPAVSE
jgi:hypothetical protein